MNKKGTKRDARDQDVKIRVKKRGVKAKEEKEKAAVVEEERSSGEESVVMAAENGRGWEEYWSLLNGEPVDEQMSWGSFWLPYWDVEFVGEAYNWLYGDVVWDDDIWDLKRIKEVPNP